MQHGQVLESHWIVRVSAVHPGTYAPQTGPPGAPTARRIRACLARSMRTMRRADTKPGQASLAMTYRARSNFRQRHLAAHRVSQTQLPSPPAPNARWDRAHQQQRRRHASRNHPERPTARVCGGSFCAGGAAPQELCTPGRYSNRTGSSECLQCIPGHTQPQTGPPGAPTAPLGLQRPNQALACASYAHPALTHQSSRLRALRAQPAHRQVPPPSRRLTASASRTTGESAKFASPAWHMPFALPRQSNL